MSNYKNQEIQQLFNIAADTVRVWSNEFQEYLSPLAVPEDGKHRVFNHEDLRVFALISNLRDKKFGYDEIHAALKSGQRGDVPEVAESRALDYRVEQQLQLAQHTINELREKISVIEVKSKELHDDNIRLQTSEQHARKRVEELTEEINEAREKYQNELKQLQREIGRIEARLEMEKENKNKDE